MRNIKKERMSYIVHNKRDLYFFINTKPVNVLFSYKNTEYLLFPLPLYKSSKITIIVDFLIFFVIIRFRNTFQQKMSLNGFKNSNNLFTYQ